MAEWIRTHPAAAAKLAGELDEALVCRARVDINTFAEYVMRDEETGLPWSQAATHVAWHKALDDNDRMLIWAHIESGKTNQISIMRTLFELGQNPNLRFGILSNADRQAKKIVSSISTYIERSPELRRVFPNLLPGDEWTDTTLRVKRQIVAKDPSIQSFSYGSKNIIGSRIDRLIIDDILNHENTRTPLMREQLWQWLQASALGRLTANARMRVVGTAFNPDDALHRFARMFGAARALRFPAIDDVTGALRWPERWSASRLAEAKLRLGPLEFARQLLCIARDDGDARFKSEWIKIALERGKANQLAYALAQVPPGFRVFTGVDLAVQQHASADKTALVTIIVHPDGSREILEIQLGRWAGPQIVEKIIDVHQRFHSIVIVENNAAQDFILQFTKAAAAIPIKPFTTGRNKAHPEFGIESIAAELAGGKWIFPNEGGISTEMDALIQGMLYYDAKSHTHDALMAMWFAREGARMATPRAEVGRLDLMRR